MRKASPTTGSRLQGEIWALALLLLAVLLALSLVPPASFGDFGIRLFPTGNIVGRVGGFVARSAWAFAGVGAVAIPLLPAVWALVVLNRISRPTHLRLTGLIVGWLILGPTGIYAFTWPLLADPPTAGWIGRALGAPLAAAFGWVGTGLLVVFSIIALLAATLRWNPLRTLARAGEVAWMGSRYAVEQLSAGVAGVQSWLAARRARHAESGVAVTEPDLEAAVLSPWAPPDIDATLVDEDAEPEIEDRPSGPARQAPAAAARRRGPAALPDSGDPTSADLPTADLLNPAPPRDETRNRKHLDGLGQVLIEKLATFKIQGEIVGTTTGPVVTQFEISPAPGVKVARIANLEADLALAMKAPSVRIVAPIPGKGAVGVEVPNAEAEMVCFREVLESPAYRNSKAQLPLVLGKDLAGRPYVADLTRMPHLLIAGATGSGKSVCINTLVTSLVYRHSPQTLRFLMIDPKMVELSVYNDLPHLRHPVVTDNSEAAVVLRWALLEMDVRYRLLSTNNVRNIEDFNRRVQEGHLLRAVEPQGEEGNPERWVYRAGRLPYIVLIIDELADLMMTVQGEVEKPLAVLAQKARAIGIHLILATQRPSVNVLTGLIKANFPSRIAFRVSSKVDSRTILDQNGADALLGNGDMLFLPPGRSEPSRIQGAYLSTEETERLMRWYRERAQERVAESAAASRTTERDILEIVRDQEGLAEEFDAGDEVVEDFDRLFREAAELCIQHQGGSTSLLQRRLRIGYGRAARIIDQLHQAGILGPADGSRPREVLVDFVQLEQMYPEER